MKDPNDPAEGTFDFGPLVADLALAVLVGWTVSYGSTPSAPPSTASGTR